MPLRQFDSRLNERERRYLRDGVCTEREREREDFDSWGRYEIK